MIEIRYKITPTRLALGGSITGISGGLLAYSTAFGVQWFVLPFGALLFFLGILAILSGCFEVVSAIQMLPKWNEKLIRKALHSAPPDTTIRILQTWLPDREDFCPFLENLLTEGGKQFRLEFLLMDSEKADIEFDDLLAARIRLRAETRSDAHHEIEASKSRLMNMKQRVDAAWETKYLGAKLALEIRTYKFMPFGPVYQVGQNHIFIGYYLNFESSVHGPMLVIRNPKSRTWTLFEDHLNRGWQDSEKDSEIRKDAQ